MKTNKLFNILINISLIVFITFLIFLVMLKAVFPQDLIANYNFLSTFTLKQRLIRGLNLIEFYQIEIQLNEFKKAVILDILNIIIFIPFGILITHLFKTKKILKTLIITIIFSLSIEIFQLITIIGACMLNDLITNIIGGLIGSLIYIFVTKNKKYKIYNILLIIFSSIIIILLFYLIYKFITNIEIYKNLFNKNVFQ